MGKAISYALFQYKQYSVTKAIWCRMEVETGVDKISVAGSVNSNAFVGTDSTSLENPAATDLNATMTESDARRAMRRLTTRYVDGE
jgi:hypothetical protein